MLQKNIGNERVLTALADTMDEFSSIDLGETHLAPLPEPPEKTPTSTNPAATGNGNGNGARYVEVGEIGRGGLGVVLEAFDQDLRRTVAIKRPRDDRMAGRALTSLVAEAQITAQLDHPNIPAVHSLGIDDKGRPYFTMTRLRGQSLAQILDARRHDPELQRELTTGRLLRIFLQVGYAVAFANDRGVLHRDLKPDNVIIGEFGEVRVMDWGIAKVLQRDDDPTGAAVAELEGEAEPPPPSTGPGSSVSTSTDQPETKAGAFVGTPGYASPEQVSGDKAIDIRADVYSLGAMLYEMLAGRPPVEGDTTATMIANTLHGEIVPINKVVPIGDRLAAVIGMALAKNPDDRYSTVVELLDDVEAVIEGRPVRALDECVVHRAGRWYLARTPSTARLRNLEIDLISWSSFLFGMCTVMLLGAWLPTWTAWGILAVAIASAIPPIYTMMRKPRPDDPGYLLAFDGSGGSRSFRPSTSGNPHTAATVRNRGESSS